MVKLDKLEQCVEEVAGPYDGPLLLRRKFHELKWILQLGVRTLTF